MTRDEYVRTLAKYITGFVLSLALTIVAYALVTTGGLFESTSLLIVLGVLALVQMIVQLVLFLHVTDEEGPRYRLFTFGFMATILLIIVVGSLWIMHHLNYNMMQMSPNEKDEYMTGQRDKGF